MNWAKPELTREQLYKMREEKESDYTRWLRSTGKNVTTTEHEPDRDKKKPVLRKRSDLALDMDEGRRGWKHKRFTSNPQWTWGAFSALCEYVEAENWHYFVTITAKHGLTLNAARKACTKWCEELGALVLTQSGKSLVVFWVLEQHRSGYYHAHAVVRFPNDFMKSVPPKTRFNALRTFAQSAIGGKRWKNREGKLGLWHRVDVKSYDEAGAKYLTKYITKGLSDWDFFCILKGERNDAFKSEGSLFKELEKEEDESNESRRERRG